MPDHRVVAPRPHRCHPVRDRRRFAALTALAQGPRSVRWHRFREDTFDVGRETIEVDEGLFIGIYSAERNLIDAFRLRHQEGDELAVEALRRWLERPGATPANLLAMAKHFPKAEPSLLQTLRVLS